MQMSAFLLACSKAEASIVLSLSMFVLGHPSPRGELVPYVAFMKATFIPLRLMISGVFMSISSLSEAAQGTETDFEK